MSSIRQDAWSIDEDLILAEVVLRHIREGGTQLAAFEEVGERLSRTSAACGFRWNSTIRKKYESAIALARKQRSKLKKNNESIKETWDEEAGTEIGAISHKPELVAEPVQETVLEPPNEMNEQSPLTMEKVLEFLENYHKNQENQNSSEIERLERENQSLKEHLTKLEEEKRMMTEDYRALLSIMDRARKLSIYQESRELVEPSTK